jgi:hypothetical protein
VVPSAPDEAERAAPGARRDAGVVAHFGSRASTVPKRFTLRPTHRRTYGQHLGADRKSRRPPRGDPHPYVESWHTVSVASGAVLAALGECSTQEPANKLRRISLPRTLVNKGKKRRSEASSALGPTNSNTFVSPCKGRANLEFRTNGPTLRPVAGPSVGSSPVPCTEGNRTRLRPRWSSGRERTAAPQNPRNRLFHPSPL